MLANGADVCSCRKTECRRNGKCDECIAFHTQRGSLTYCQREAKKAAKKDEKPNKA